MGIDHVHVAESLLLVSLLWFMGSTCQLSLAPVLLLTPKVVPPENVGQRGLRRLALKRGENKIFDCFELESSVKSRRCRASRTKMKFEFFFFNVNFRLLSWAFNPPSFLPFLHFKSKYRYYILIGKFVNGIGNID